MVIYLPSAKSEQKLSLLLCLQRSEDILHTYEQASS